MAQHFGVSYQASVYRLRSLGHVSQTESANLLKREGFGRDYLRVLGLHEANDQTAHVTDQRIRYRELQNEIKYLAIEAYLCEEISRGRLLELSILLEIDGRELLEVGDNLRLQ